MNFILKKKERKELHEYDFEKVLNEQYGKCINFGDIGLYFSSAYI